MIPQETLLLSLILPLAVEWLETQVSEASETVAQAVQEARVGTGYQANQLLPLHHLQLHLHLHLLHHHRYLLHHHLLLVQGLTKSWENFSNKKLCRLCSCLIHCVMLCGSSAPSTSTHHYSHHRRCGVLERKDTILDLLCFG